MSVKSPTTFWRKRKLLAKYSIWLIVSYWGGSVLLAFFPLVIPKDRYRAYPFGLTLSETLDYYMVYESFLIAGVLVLWVLNVACFIQYKRSRTATRSRLAGKKRPSESPCPACSKHEACTDTTCVVNRLKLNPVSSKASRFASRHLLSNLCSAILSLTLCYLPLIVTQALTHLRCIDFENHTEEFNKTANRAFNTSMLIASRFVLFNSFLNAIIYGVRSKRLNWKNVFWWYGLSCERNRNVTIGKAPITYFRRLTIARVAIK